MKYAYIDGGGRITSAHNASKVTTLPANAYVLTDLQWAQKLHLRWTGSAWVYDPRLPPLAQRQAEAWERIKAERDRRMAGGVKAAVTTLPVTYKWFQSDTNSRIQLSSLQQKGLLLPSGIDWRTLDGSYVVLTSTIVENVFNAAIVLDRLLFDNADDHKAAMMASSTPETYNFSTGWPERYGG